MDYRQPIYIQLREVIREKIEDGEYKFGDLIPSEREMANTYGINRMTVKNAVDGLVKEGLLKKVQGKGTFVLSNKVKRDLESLTGLSAAMRAKGLSPSSKVILKEALDDISALNDILNIPSDQKVFRILRLRLANSEPSALEDTYVPYEIFKDIDEVNFEVISLYDYMELKGIKVKLSYQTLTLVKANNREAKLLCVPKDTPIFLFEYLSKDEKGRIVEYTKSYTRGDKISYEVLLK